MADTIHLSGIVRSAALLAAWAIVLNGCGGDRASSADGDDPDLLFEETFSYTAEGVLPMGWTLITQETATEEGPANWRVKSGRLNQSSNVHAPATPGMSYAVNYEGTMAIVGDSSWANIELEARLIPHDDDGIGVIFRWQPSQADGDGNFYRFMIVSDQDSGGPRARVDRRIDGVWTILGEDSSTLYEYQESSSYKVEIAMVIDEFTIRLDGEPLFTFSDSSIPNGRIGLFCYAEEGADFDDIRVYRRGP